MEPIPFFYQSINRNAILVKHKKPFFDWINTIDPDSLITTVDESNIYLVSEKDNLELVEKWLSRNFDKIFVNELNDWYTDDYLWPRKRTYQMFKEWFDFEIHSMILDVEDGGIVKE